MRVSSFVRAAVLVFCICQPLQAATIEVNTTSDVIAVDGACSLREAITAVNKQAASGNMTGECAAGDGNADTIAVPAGVYTLTLAGIDEDNNATGDLDIRASVTVQGAERGTTIIDANGIDRVFDIPVGALNVAFSDLELANGHAPDRAGVGGESGGAIDNPNGANVSLTRVDLSANRSGNGALNGGAGGAIFSNGGSVQLIGCALENNHTGAGGVGGDPGGGNGGNGGAVATNGTILGIERSVISSSRTGDGQAGANSMGYPGFGGALYANGGTVTILQSAFDGNSTSSQADGGLYGYGGALYLSGTVAHIVQASITRNTAYGGSGIYSIENYPVTLSNVTVSENHAAVTGGGIFIVGGSMQLDFTTVSANQAGFDHAGGIRAEPGSAAPVIRFRNSIIAGNIAGSPADCYTFSAGQSPFVSQGYNVVGASCPSGATADIATTTPRLGPLGDNGGIGLTQMPQPGSPATDRASCLASGIADDGRGHARLIDIPRVPDSVDACDSGAVELDDDIFWDGFGT